jgi:hypothetical protein
MQELPSTDRWSQAGQGEKIWVIHGLIVMSAWLELVGKETIRIIDKYTAWATGF